MKIILAIAIAMLGWILGYYLHFLPVPEPEIYQYITLFLITIVQPSAIYWTIWQNFRSGTHLGEYLEMELTPDIIKIRSKSVYMEMKWANIFKIEERKRYFLIYQNNLSAIIIPKKDLPESEQDELRHILRDIPDVPADVKKV